MDSTPVNWEALDALIIDFAKSENLFEDSYSSSSSLSSPPSSPSSSSSPSPSSSSYHSRLVIRQIRRSLEAGDVDAAIDLLRNHAPFILDDHRLLFRLQKQVCLIHAPNYALLLFVFHLFGAWTLNFNLSYVTFTYWLSSLVLFLFYGPQISRQLNSVPALCAPFCRLRMSKFTIDFCFWFIFLWRNLLSFWEEGLWKAVTLQLIAWELL